MVGAVLTYWDIDYHIQCEYEDIIEDSFSTAGDYTVPIYMGDNTKLWYRLNALYISGLKLKEIDIETNKTGVKLYNVVITQLELNKVILIGDGYKIINTNKEKLNIILGDHDD